MIDARQEIHHDLAFFQEEPRTGLEGKIIRQVFLYIETPEENFCTTETKIFYTDELSTPLMQQHEDGISVLALTENALDSLHNGP